MGSGGQSFVPHWLITSIEWYDFEYLLPTNTRLGQHNNRGPHQRIRSRLSTHRVVSVGIIVSFYGSQYLSDNLIDLGTHDLYTHYTTIR